MVRLGKFAFLLAIPLFIGCQRAGNGAGPKAGTEKPFVDPSDAVPNDRHADDTARFLAGIPGKPGSLFIELEETGAWKQHRADMDAAWDAANEKLITGLHEFQQRELSSSALEHSVLFYPFSGPDALTATVCFPQSPAYVLVALEPAGTLPSLRQVEKKELARYLAEVRKTLASELGKSFFVTREMDRQFRGQITDGLLIPMLVLLARTDHTVQGMKYVRLDEQGKVADRQGGVPVEAEYANKGFELEFSNNSDQSRHRLYYFSLNLSNKKLDGNAGFLRYANSLPSPITMLKATSYMPHHPDFSTIRDIVVNRSGAVFQDDSGIPYHFFTSGDWNVQLYGDYTKPYGSFRWLEQNDLRKAYLNGGVKPLTMRIGYGFGKVTSNLLLATRKPAKH